MTERSAVRGREIWPVVQRDHKPWTRWWWLGSAVDEKNLTRELEALHAAGLGGVEITPIYGIMGAESRHVEFLSDRWLELMLHVCREARRLDLGVDIVAGCGWRMGGAHVPEEERAVRLLLRKETTPEGLRYTAVAEPSGEKIKRPGPGGAGYSIDILNAQAVSNYQEWFTTRFFSRVPAELVRAQFHDSWEYDTNWSRGLLEEFRARRGYDLQAHLAVFDKDGAGVPGDTAARVLHDYRVTVEELLLENFARNWSSICRRRGMLTRNQAHGSIGNLLDIYALADIPETEIFGERVDPLVNKFASSAAHVAGRKLVSAESFTWLSDHWLSDLGKIKRYTDHLFLSGINHIFFHGTAYSPDDVAWPGWLFYASTQLNSRNPIWRDLPALNAYIARCQSFLQAGVPDDDVLIYWPVSDLYLRTDGTVHKFYINGDEWTFGESLRQTARDLWEKGFQFDYVSDRQLQQASAAEGQLRMPGGAYRAIVLPPLRHIPLQTVMALRQLAQAGVPVICHGDPCAWDVPGLHELERQRAELKQAVKALAGQASFVAVDDPGKALASFHVKAESFAAGTGLRCVRRKLDDGDRLYFIANRSEKAFDGWIEPAAGVATATLLDAWTGGFGTALVQADKGIRLQLEPQQSAIVLLSDRKRTDANWSYDLPQENKRTDVPGPWKVSFVAGGPTLPAPVERNALVSITEFGDPELERFGGTVRYETRFDAASDAGADWMLDLGDVKHSARVILNGTELGVRVLSPYRFEIPAEVLQRKGNLLAVDVTTLAANRIRDLDRRQVPWRIFHDINFVNVAYKPFDASHWELAASGLLGPVSLAPMNRSARVQ